MKIIWVATTGSDTTGDGSKDLPYATLDKALTVFENGDQIRLLDGVYYPSDSLVISNKEGSLFSENPGGATIRPRKTTTSTACIKIASSNRFSIQGINVIQAIDSNNNLMGIYAENVENFLCSTCFVSDFTAPSGDVYGILAHGGLGRIEQCQVEDLVCGGNNLKGIFTASSGASGGLDIIDCSVRNLSGAGNCTVVPVEIGPYTPPGPGPSPGPTYYDPYFYFWQFDRFAPADATRGGYLMIGAGEAAMDDFSPDQWGGDFTVMGVVMSNAQLRKTADTATLFGKREYNGNGIEWAIEKVGSSPKFYFRIGRAGFASTDAGDTIDMCREKRYFVCGRYTAIGQGTSQMKLWVNNDTYVNNSAWLISKQNFPLLIGAQQGTGLACFYAKYFWLAFWPRALTDLEIENIRDESTVPSLQSPQFYIDFRKDDNKTLPMNYQSEIGSGSNAPYIFAKTQISGNPDHELWRHRGEYITDWWRMVSPSSDYLKLPEADSGDFDPANNGNDFSFVTLVQVGDAVGSGWQHMFSKWNSAGERSWSLALYDDGSTYTRDLYFLVSSDGSWTGASDNGVTTQIYISGAATPKYLHPISFVAGTYEYNGVGATNTMKLYYNKTVTTKTDGFGPIHVPSPCDLYINRRHGTTPEYTSNVYYYIAYWQRLLSSSEVESLRTGEVTLQSMNPLFAMYFDNPVGGNYISEIGGYNFSVGGSPVHWDWSTGMPGI